MRAPNALRIGRRRRRPTGRAREPGNRVPGHRKIAEPPRSGHIRGMQTATETERKYDVPAGFTLPPLTGAGEVSAHGDAETHDLDATYFDTEDLRLARHRRT